MAEHWAVGDEVHSVEQLAKWLTFTQAVAGHNEKVVVTAAVLTDLIERARWHYREFDTIEKVLSDIAAGR